MTFPPRWQRGSRCPVKSNSSSNSSSNTELEVPRLDPVANMSVHERLQYHQQALSALEQVLSQKKRGRPNKGLIAENTAMANEHRQAIARLQQHAPAEEQQIVVEAPAPTLNAWQQLSRQKTDTHVQQLSAFPRFLQHDNISDALSLVRNDLILPDNYDNDTLRLWELLVATAHTTQKLDALQAAVGAHSDKIVSGLRTLGATLETLSRHEQIELEGLLGSCIAAQNRIQFLDLRSYDETPLWLTQLINLAKLGAAPVADTSESALILHSAAARMRVPASPVKVVVFRSGFSMLLKIGGEYVSISGRTAAGIRTAKQLTGPTMAQLALNASGATAFANTFNSTVAIPLTDSHASNIQGEQLIKHNYRKTWQSNHLKCEVHPQATTHKSVFSLETGFFSGVCHIGLVHKTMTYHDIFIQCCMEEIDDLLDIEEVNDFSEWPALDPDAVAYKRFQLRIFFSRGSNIEVRKALLVHSLPGDWRTDRIKFPVLRRLEVPESTVRAVVKHGVKQALFDRRCPMFNSSDWVGSDLALDWIGAVEAPYRLYSRSMARFYKVMRSTRKDLLILGNASVLQLGDEVPAADPANSSEQGHVVDDSDNDHRKRVAKAIFVSSNFSDKDELLGRLMRGRLVLEGLREGMADRLEVGSKEWEKHQLSVEARSSLAGNTGPKRKYPLTIAATMSHERFFPTSTAHQHV